MDFVQQVRRLLTNSENDTVQDAGIIGVAARTVCGTPEDVAEILRDAVQTHRTMEAPFGENAQREYFKKFKDRDQENRNAN